MLLAIDTSAGASVALVDGARGTLVEHSESDTRSHAEVIGQLIKRCLDDCAIGASALSGVAIGMGPGPFTGLRVGIAAAQAFAFGAARPLLRVVSHDAIAFAHYAAGNRDPLLVVTDARRREVYVSSFFGVDEFGIPVRAAQPMLCRPEDLATTVPGFEMFTRIDSQQVSAAAIGLLAQGLLAQEREFAGPEPLYLRAPDATISTGPKRVS